MDDLDKSALKALGLMLLAALIAIFLIWLVTIIFPQDANAAEADSLYFTSATDMIAQVDSIEAVCDTSYGHRVASVITCDWFGRGFVETKANELFRIITCRELICVVVIARPDSVRYEWQTTYPAQYRKIRGQMVVWWREVVR